MVREETDKKTTSSPDTLWHEIWKDMSDASRRKGKRKCAVEKPKLDNARRLRGIFFIDPEHGEFKDIMKNASRNLEVPMQATVPCKTSSCRSSRKTCRVEKNCKADESTRKRMEGSRE